MRVGGILVFVGSAGGNRVYGLDGSENLILFSSECGVRFEAEEKLNTYSWGGGGGRRSRKMYMVRRFTFNSESRLDDAKKKRKELLTYGSGLAAAC